MEAFKGEVLRQSCEAQTLAGCSGNKRRSIKPNWRCNKVMKAAKLLCHGGSEVEEMNSEAR